MAMIGFILCVSDLLLILGWGMLAAMHLLAGQCFIAFIAVVLCIAWIIKSIYDIHRVYFKDATEES